MASTLKKMLKRRSHHHDTTTSTTASLFPPVIANSIEWKKKSELKESNFFPMLLKSRRKVMRQQRMLVQARYKQLEKDTYNHFSATLVASNEVIHPRKFMRRLRWDNNSLSPKDTAHDIFPIDIEAQEERKRAMIALGSSVASSVALGNTNEETSEATQPFVSLVLERRRNAALANAIHFLCEDSARRMSQPPRTVCCHESLILLLGRESNLCFGCANRKPLGLTLCWPCYEAYLEVAPHSTVMDFLTFTLGTRMGPTNCGKHQEVDNAAVLVQDADDYLRLCPRIGLNTSTASILVAQSSSTASADKIRTKAVLQLGRVQLHSIMFVELLQKHSRKILLLPSDRYVARTQTLPKAWSIAISIGIAAMYFKAHCPSILRRKQFMKKTVARMRMQKAGAAFNKWCHMVQEVLENRKKVQGALKRFLMREVTKAFNQWHEYAHKQKQAKTLARRILARQLGALKVIYFDLWAEAAEGAAVEKQRKIENMILKWRMMPAVLAMRAWVDVVIMMKKARKFARRIVMLAAARSMNAWLELVHANKRVRSFLRKQMLRMQNRRVARLFDAWLIHTDMALDIKEEKIRQILLRINKRWERQFFINLTVQYHQTISARRIQNWVRRIDALMVLKQLQKQARKKERRRVRQRSIYVNECVNLALHAAKTTFAKHPSTIRKLVRLVRNTQKEEKEVQEVNTLLSQKTAQNALDLFTALHIEEGIKAIPLEGVTPDFLDSLNDVLRTRMEEEHQEQRELIWEEWSVQAKLKQLRTYLNIKKTKRLLARDFLDKRIVMFESAWRSSDPGGNLTHANVHQIVSILSRMNLKCVRGSAAIEELIEEKGTIAMKTDTSPSKKKKTNKRGTDDIEKNTVLERDIFQNWFMRNTDSKSHVGIYELSGFSRTGKLMRSISTGARARREAQLAINAVVKEEAEEFAGWYYDALDPPDVQLECCLCSSTFVHWKLWMIHIQTCTGKDEEHERHKHRSIPFRCAYDILCNFPCVLKASILGNNPDVQVMETSKEETDDTPKTREQVKAAAASTLTAILGSKKESEEEAIEKERTFQETIAVAWETNIESAVDHEFDNFLEHREMKRRERIEARHLRREARTTRRNRRKQQVLNARWAHKKAVLQKRTDQLQEERVFIPGAGVDSRFGTIDQGSTEITE